MLLTSSQISMGISSAIVFTFSTLLFLSGYILQQQTVRDLQIIIRPVPEPSSSLSSSDTIDSTTTIPTDTEVNWNRVAYVQVLQYPSKACSAAIIFAELARQKSKAKRILLYPQRWLAESLTSDIKSKSGSQVKKRELEYTVRFLRKIAARYDVRLKPVELESGVENGHKGILSMNEMYALTEWQTLMYLNPSGVIYNATALDELFALDPTGSGMHFPNIVDSSRSESEAEITSTSSSIQQEVHRRPNQPIAALLKPSMATYQQILLTYPGQYSIQSTLTATNSAAKHAIHLFSSTDTLKSTQHGYQDEDSKLTSPIESSIPAYLYFSESRLPGPDFDIPRDTWVKERPESNPKRKLWDGAYADYRMQRMGVCGLDVQVLPKNWSGMQEAREKEKEKEEKLEDETMEMSL